MPYLKTGGANIFYEQKGQGPPLLLIAGMSRDASSWQYILKELTDKFELIMFDNRGCGRSTFGDAFSLSDIAGDALALLDHLGHNKAHVCGHSMGGMVAQEMALNHPEKIDKLILASTSPKLSLHALGILDDLLVKWENNYDAAEWFRELYQWLFSPSALGNKKFIDAAIIFALSYPYAQTLDGFRTQVRAITQFDLSSNLKGITNNTLLISGTEDILIPPEESKQLLDIRGKTTFSTIVGAAHSLHAEKPGEFAALVNQFLR